MTLQAPSESNNHLRSLYRALLLSQSCFDEFKRLLRLYPAFAGEESTDAAAVREVLNNRIRSWIGGEFSGLSTQQTLQWRAIILDERANLTRLGWGGAHGN